MLDISTLTPKDKAFLSMLKDQGKSPQDALSILETVKPKPVSLPPSEVEKYQPQPEQPGRLESGLELAKTVAKGGYERGRGGVEKIIGGISGEAPILAGKGKLEEAPEGFLERAGMVGRGLHEFASGAIETAASPFAGVLGLATPEIQKGVETVKTGAEKVGSALDTAAEKGLISREYSEVLKSLPKEALAAYESLPPDIKSAMRSGIDIIGLQQAPKVSKAMETGVQKIPGALKAGKETIESGIEAAKPYIDDLSKGIVKGAETGLEATKSKLGLAVPKTMSEVDDVIDDALTKAIRPSVKGMKQTSDLVKFQDRAREAIKTIAQNKNNLEFIDDATGEIIKGKLPENLMEASSALTQTKKSIYNQYNSLSKAAGAKGAVLQMDDAIGKLQGLVDDVMTTPEVSKHAMKRIEWLSKIKKATPEQVEVLVKNLNENAPNMFSSGATKSKALVDVSLAKLLRDNLDNTITNTLETGGYQQLKNQYGALKSIEKDLLNRALVDARKNVKGFMDITDVFSGGDLAQAAITMNPALLGKAAAQKGISELWKHLNDPNRMIKSMFQKVDQFYNPPTSMTDEIVSGAKALAKNKKGSFSPLEPLSETDDTLRQAARDIGAESKATGMTPSQLMDEANKSVKVKSPKGQGEIPQTKTLYHGTIKPFEKFDISKMTDGNTGRGIYLTDQSASAKYYGKLKAELDILKKGEFPDKIPDPSIMEITLSPNTRIKHFDRLPSKEMVQTAKKNGFDGISYKDEIIENVEGISGLPKSSNTIMLFDDSSLSINKAGQSAKTTKNSPIGTPEKIFGKEEILRFF